MAAARSGLAVEREVEEQEEGTARQDGTSEAVCTREEIGKGQTGEDTLGPRTMAEEEMATGADRMMTRRTELAAALVAQVAATLGHMVSVADASNITDMS